MIIEYIQSILKSLPTQLSVLTYSHSCVPNLFTHATTYPIDMASTAIYNTVVKGIMAQIDEAGLMNSELKSLFTENILCMEGGNSVKRAYQS